MGKIMIFGSTNIYTIPSEVIKTVEEYSQAGWQFIVGHRNGADSVMHKILSGHGARQNTLIYGLDYINNNKFELPEYIFKTQYDIESKVVRIMDNTESIIMQEIEGIEKAEDIRNNSKYYRFIDEQMIRDCDFAICLWDGQSKTELSNIQQLGIVNKPCYRFIQQQ